jgi:hypothetical protein
MTIAENLLRLYRWQLDERRRYLTELESLAERLRVEVRRLTAEIDPAAGMSDHVGEGYDARTPFSRRLIERRKKLEHSVAEIQQQVIGARAAIVAAAHEVQLREIAATHRTGAPTDGAIRRSRSSRRTLSIPVLSQRHGS